MKTPRKLPSALLASGVLCLAFFGGAHINSALAQNETRSAQQDDSGPFGQANRAASPARPTGPPPMMLPAHGDNLMGRMMQEHALAAAAANSSYLFILRGSTIYQFRQSDLTLVTQRELPAPNRPLPGKGPPN